MTNTDQRGESAQAGGEKDWTSKSVYILAILTLISTLNYFDRSVLSLVLPLVKEEFKVSDTRLGEISSLIVFYAIAGVPIAWLAERWSRRNVIAIGVAFWSAMTAMTGFASSIVHVAICRFLMAVGEGGGLAPSQSLLTDVFSRARRPLVLSIITTASSIAAIVYSPAAGWIADNWGWRAVFVAAGLPGIVVAIIFFFTVKEPPRRSPLADRTAPLWEAVGFLAGSKAYLLCLLGTSLMGIYLYGVGAWDATFLHRVRDLSLTQIGAFILPVRGVVAAVGIVLGGLLATRLERGDARWRCWVPALACFALGPLEFAYVFAGPISLWYPFMLGAALVSIMHQGPIYAAYTSVARPRMRAVSVSIALLGATATGQFGGPILIGRMNDAMQAQYGDHAIRYSFLVLCIVPILAGLAFAAAGLFIARDMQRAQDA